MDGRREVNSRWARSALLALAALLMAQPLQAAPATTVACNYADGGLRELCQLADPVGPSGLDDYVPAPAVMGVLLQVYVNARVANGNRPPSVSQLRERLATTLPILQEQADTLLGLVDPALDAAVRMQIREQLLQVLLCPAVIAPGLASDQKVCGDTGPRPGALTHREKIIEALNKYYVQQRGATCPNTVCVAAESLPVDVINALPDWGPALEAEIGRQDRCKSGSSVECTTALRNAAIRTATALAVDSQLGQGLSSAGRADNTVASKCLASLAARIAPGTGDSMKPLGSVTDIQLPDVPILWAAPNQERRRALENRLAAWNWAAKKLSEDPSYAAQLTLDCRRSAVANTIAHAARSLPTISPDPPSLDARGNLPAPAFSLSRGYHDFRTGGGDGPLVAMRLRFPAVLQPNKGDCSLNGVVGALSFIVRYRGESRHWRGLELPSGVDDLKLTGLCKRDATMSFTDYSMSNEQLRRSLQQLLPPPLLVQQVRAELHHEPEKEGLGRLLLKISASVGIVGMSDTVPVTWEIGRSDVDLDHAQLFALVKPLLEKRLATVFDGASLSFTPPDACPGISQPAAPEKALTLYTCLQLPQRLGLFNRMPAVLAQVEFDAQGGFIVRLPSTAIQQLKKSLQSYLEEQVQSLWKGGGASNDAQLANVQLQALPSGVRILLPITLRVGGHSLPWPITLDLSYKVGGSSIGDQLKSQLPSLESLEVLASGSIQRQLLESFDQALGNLSFLGLKIIKRDLPNRIIDLELSTPIPQLTALPVRVNLTSSEAVPNALAAAIREAINGKLGGKVITYAGITMEKIHLKDDRWVLESEAVFYRNPRLAALVTLPLDGRFIPSIDKESINKQALAGLVGEALKKVLASSTGSASKVDVDWLGGVPILHVEMTVNLKIFGGSGFSGNLTARMTQPANLALDKVRIDCTAPTCWLPLGTTFQIGGFSLNVDLQNGADLVFGAVLAITDAAETQKLLRLNAQLTVGKPIELEANLIILDSMDAGVFHAVLDVENANLRMDGVLKVPILELPISKTLVEIDGKRCVLVGRATDNFLGVVRVDIFTGLKFAHCQQDLTGASREILAVVNLCDAAGKADVAACGTGSGEILGQRVAITATMPLVPLRAPAVSAEVKVIGITLQTEVQRSRVKMKARVGHVVAVTLLLPPLGRFTKNQVAELLEKILKPKLDWDAIKDRDITLSLLPAGASKEEGEASENSASSAREYADQAQQAAAEISDVSKAPQMPPRVTRKSTPIRTTIPSPTPTSIDCDSNRIYFDNPTKGDWWGISSEICRKGLNFELLLNADPLSFDNYKGAMFCKATASGCADNEIQISPTARKRSMSGRTVATFVVPEAVRGLLGSPWQFYSINAFRGLIAALSKRAQSAVNVQAACIQRENIDKACVEAVVILDGKAIYAGFGIESEVSADSMLGTILSLQPREDRLPGKLAEILQQYPYVAMAGAAGHSVYLVVPKSLPPTQPPEYQWIALSIGADGQLTSRSLPIVSTEDPSAGHPIPKFLEISKLLQATIVRLAKTVKTQTRCVLGRDGFAYCESAENGELRAYAATGDSQSVEVVERSAGCIRQELKSWRDNGLVDKSNADELDGLTDAKFLEALVVDSWSWKWAQPKETRFRANPRLLVTNPPVSCEATP